MRIQLEGTSSPLDATLETILPGVHERLDAQRKATEDIHGLLRHLEYTMKDCIESSQDSTMERLETEINLMFKRIRAPGAEDRVQDERVASPSRDHSPNHTAQVTPANATCAGAQFPTMPITYSSLHQLYDHWNGDGEYRNMYEGGIARLESEKGPSWRKSWDNSANKRLSKLKSIVSAIQRESMESGMSITDILSLWGDIYSGPCNGKLSNFHTWAVANGKVLLKKARGKSTDR